MGENDLFGHPSAFERALFNRQNVSTVERLIMPRPRPLPPAQDGLAMFDSERGDLIMFGFVLIIVCLVSGLYSCMVNVVAKQQRKFNGRVRHYSPVTAAAAKRRRAAATAAAMAAVAAAAVAQEEGDHASGRRTSRDIDVSSITSSSSDTGHTYSETARREDILY